MERKLEDMYEIEIHTDLVQRVCGYIATTEEVEGFENILFGIDDVKKH